LLQNKKLTKAEIDALEHKKYLLRLAKEKAGLIVKDDGYQLPQDEFNEKGKIDSARQQDLLKARHPFPPPSFAFLSIALLSPPQQLDYF
jgi:hypothetical protein